MYAKNLLAAAATGRFRMDIREQDALQRHP